MIVNGRKLYDLAPIQSMLLHKGREHGVSHGLSEAGYDLRIAQDVTLHPFKPFMLASTMERFHMPRDLVAIVHDKSTWARKGLSVFNTVIEPGWRGVLTLELTYHGWKPLKIKAGSGIAQALFHQVMEPAQYDGKYQDQPEGPVAARFVC